MENIGVSEREVKGCKKRNYYVKKPKRPIKAQVSFRLEVYKIEAWELSHIGESFSDWVKGVVNRELMGE